MTRHYFADFDLNGQDIDNRANNPSGGRELLTVNRTYYVATTV